MISKEKAQEWIYQLRSSTEETITIAAMRWEPGRGRGRFELFVAGSGQEE